MKLDPFILIVTNKRDITVDFVVLEIQKRGLRYFRLNTEDITKYKIRMEDGDPRNLILFSEETCISISQITSAYYRRPAFPLPSLSASPAESAYIKSEWSALLRTIWNALGGRWLNCPFAIQQAEDKPRQLAAARDANFKVPRTLITNDFEEAKSFSKNATLVAKTLRHALLDDGNGLGKVIFTNRIQINESMRLAFSAAPIIFQDEIIKKSDIRVTVVNDDVISVQIHSQEHSDTRTDWRKGARVDLNYSIFDLPDHIETQCVKIVQSLGLRFAAIDLILVSDRK
ncbi:ATP-grasp domain-containing protein [Komagataeibacter rhaeticus]|uniref:ATP-grasp domain-containing protein n=1 Tax=Komagataeibacter rhaeticus TaxID=215221 RepID=UPI0007E027BE|nr:ATP-dependent carboxylate-amine ligase [Komagataeibacter rhaeticus]SAY46738.1 Ribosomal protein S6--L-glutamate ligase [Komagataeibacter rhaeticus]